MKFFMCQIFAFCLHDLYLSLAAEIPRNRANDPIFYFDRATKSLFTPLIEFDFVCSVAGCRFDNWQGWPEHHQTQKSGKPLSLDSSRFAIRLSPPSSTVSPRGFSAGSRRWKTGIVRVIEQKIAKTVSEACVPKGTCASLSLFTRRRSGECFSDLSISCAASRSRLIICWIFS